MARSNNDLFRVHVITGVVEFIVECEVKVYHEEVASQMEDG